MWWVVFLLGLDEIDQCRKMKQSLGGGDGVRQTDFIRTFRDKSQRSQPISKRDDAEQLTVQGDRYQQGHN